MKLTLDVENTVTRRDGKLHLDPFEKENSLVMVGVLTDQGQCLTFPFDHADRPNQDDYYERVQMFLDRSHSPDCAQCCARSGVVVGERVQV